MTEDETQPQRQEQFRQTQKMEAMGRLAAGVAHDLNNIFGVILGHCEILNLQFQIPNPAAKHIQEIDKAAQRAAALTRRLLAFSREQIIQPKVIDLNALIDDLRWMLFGMIGESVGLRLESSPELGKVEADENDITQIIMNLVVNARDAMPNGGVLIVRTANADLDEAYVRQHVGSRVGRFVMLSVSDAGQGMTREMISHIFEPFFTTKEPGKGTGLGLSTVYSTVKQSGGYISVQSELEREHSSKSTFRESIYQ